MLFYGGGAGLSETRLLIFFCDRFYQRHHGTAQFIFESRHIHHRLRRLCIFHYFEFKAMIQQPHHNLRNQATLARDIKRLSELSYQTIRAQGVDLFLKISMWRQYGYCPDLM